MNKKPPEAALQCAAVPEDDPVREEGKRTPEETG